MNYTGRTYTSKGQGVYNTVAGSIGLGGVILSALNGGNGCGDGGILGNLFGNNNKCYVTEKEASYMTALAIAESNVETQKTSKADLEKLFQEMRTQDAKIADGLIQTGTALGTLSADVSCLKTLVERNREESFRNLAEAKGYTDTRVDAEAALRHCEDEKTYLWVKAQNYVPAVLRVDPDQICGASPVSNGCCYSR